MANDILLPIQAGTLPSGFCPTTYQDILNAFSSVQNAVLSSSGGSSPTVTNLVASATKPTDTSGQTVWLQLDTNGRPTRLYYFFGAWLSFHPVVSGLTMWWFGAIANTTSFFETFDGGDTGTLGISSGAMWQLAKDANGVTIAAQFPIATGTLPSTTILSVPGSGGEENHVLLGSEVGPHTHALQNAGLNAESLGGQSINNASGHLVGGRNFSTSAPGIDVVTNANNSGAPAAGHNTMPPYVVGYLFQRTIRQYYKVT